MRKVTAYLLISENEQDEFERKVNLWIKEGFEPFGSVSCCVSSDDPYLWSQAMVQYEEVVK